MSPAATATGRHPAGAHLLPVRFWSVLLYHDKATPDLAPPIMILASLVLLSIIVVVSVSLTEVIGVREGTAA